MENELFVNASSSDCYWDSALSSMVSSPVASSSNISNDCFVLRELIGKLGNIAAATHDHLLPINMNMNMNSSTTNTTTVADFSGDPGFAERAARFSRFGSKSFNLRSNQLLTNEKLTRVSSSPSLKAIGSADESDQPPPPNPKKRKPKSKTQPPSPSPSPSQSPSKKSKPNENTNTNTTPPPEPPKDYIHVRARRGQATDSHSLAERVRREKISERMKLLQDLVPGCNKVTGKALMLDEIINYVQSLQRQVEFLSMKLASVNTRLDFNMDSLISKDMYQPNKALQHPMVAIDTTASVYLGQQQCSVDPLSLHNNTNLNIQQLPQFDQTLPQFQSFCEDDLQSIVQMGFGHTAKPN